MTEQAPCRRCSGATYVRLPDPLNRPLAGTIGECPRCLGTGREPTASPTPDDERTF